MKLKNCYLALAVMCIVSSTSALSQQKLGDLVAEGGFDWIIGKWVASTDQGQPIQLVYKWELDKHVVTAHFKMDNYESLGMIYLAAEDKIVQTGADNQGGTSKAVWEAMGDKAISKTESTRADGQVNKMGIVQSKVDANTMKVEVYAIESTGKLADTPWATLECKRKSQESEKP